MELRNLFIVTYIIDGCKHTDDGVFETERLANIRKEEIESHFKLEPNFEGVTIETHKVVYERNHGLTTVWRVDYIRGNELYSTLFYNSKKRAEKKYDEIVNSFMLTEIELEEFRVTGRLMTSNKIGTLEY